MSFPYYRIKARLNLNDMECLICGVIAAKAELDHCHVHGFTRGVLCAPCNRWMAKVDADLSLAKPRDLFHRDNCPGCRARPDVPERFAQPPRQYGVITPKTPADRPSPAVTAEDAAELEAFHPGHWPPMTRAEAVARVDAAVPGLVARQVAELLATKGITIKIDNVRQIRHLARRKLADLPRTDR